MKKRFSIILKASSAAVIAVLFASSCAKPVQESPSATNKMLLDSWIQVNYGPITPTALGSYILKDEPGDGEAIGDMDEAPFLLVEYTSKDLQGIYQSSTDIKLAQQIGFYNEGDYYGPYIWSRRDNYTISRGVEEVLGGMKVGGRRIAAVPGWLITNKEYASKEEYMDNVTGTNTIYDFTIKGIVKDIDKWQRDSIERYLTRHLLSVEQDTAKAGFYYCQTKEPVDTNRLSSDTKITINYIARLLNGQVIDTNIADTAKFYGIYDAQATYEASSINWSVTYEDITMGSSESTIIDGFAYGISKMKLGEKASFLFTSEWGYTYEGSGNRVPPYSPLRFDVEMIYPY